MKLPIIDWRITAACNNGCGFCYASAELPTMAAADLERCIEAIVESGCQAVCISGGEPLLYDQTAGVIRRLHTYGMSIFLSTNGSGFLGLRPDLEPYIAKLSLPLDGYDSTSNTITGRDNESFSRVIGILDYYASHPHNFAIKIATVLTRQSMTRQHFARMYAVLREYAIDVWKLYEFVPEGRGRTNRDVYSYDRSDYDAFLTSVADVLDTAKRERRCDIVFCDRPSRSAAYFIVQPDGSVVIPVDDGVVVDEVPLGSVLRDSMPSLTSRWGEAADELNTVRSSEKRSVVRPLHKIHVEDIDKRILLTLDADPLSDLDSLATQLRLPSEEVARRIEKLYTIRAIKNIMPVINVSQFGLGVYLVNLYFKKGLGFGSGPVVDILAHNPNVAWVAECYDWEEEDKYVIFRIAIFAESNYDMSVIIDGLRDIFGDALYRHETDIVPDKHVCRPWYLVDDVTRSGIDASHIRLDEAQRVRLNQAEYAVLSHMRSVERLTLDGLAFSTGMRAKKLIRTIDGLRTRVVINKFQIVLDAEVLGYLCYLFFVKFTSSDAKEEFEKHARDLHSVTHINTLSMGNWDLDVEVHVATSDEAFAVWNELYGAWQASILRSKVIRIEREHKFEFLIDATMDALKAHTG